jgi:hypothetical protein
MSRDYTTSQRRRIFKRCNVCGVVYNAFETKMWVRTTAMPRYYCDNCNTNRCNGDRTGRIIYVPDVEDR